MIFIYRTVVYISIIFTLLTVGEMISDTKPEYIIAYISLCLGMITSIVAYYLDRGE